MRKFKFRIWDRILKKFSYNWHDAFMYNETTLALDDVNMFFYRLERIQNDKNYVIQQCTDYVDETGREIYEGDLVTKYSSDEPVYEVKWMKAYSGYQWCLVDTKSEDQDEPDDFYGGLGEYLKVVGNILDTPPAT